MKYMTFNNSCFFAAVSNLLEEHNIDVLDRVIIKGSLVPYMFMYDSDSNHFLNGYQIQEMDVMNDFLKQYILKLCEMKFLNGTLKERKEELIKNLTLTNTKKIVSLKTTTNQSFWHATVFISESEGKYRFLNMRRSEDEVSEYVLTYDELLEKLGDSVQFAWLERINSFSVLDKKKLLKRSIEVLDLLEENMIEFSYSVKSHQKRMEYRDILFKPLLLNYVDIAKIIDQSELYDHLLHLQSSYIKTFKIDEDIKLSDYIDIELIRKCIDVIKDLITSQMGTTYYHGSKISGINKLYPNMSIHGEKYVYLTTKREVALIYTVNAIESFYKKKNLDMPNKFHPWYSYGFMKGKVQIDEYYPNAFKETYLGKSGYLYKCCEPKVDISNKTNIYCAVTTKEEIEVIDETYVDDVYKELLKLESKGIIEIRRYEDWNEKQLKDIDESIKGTINHFDLYNKPEYHYTVFLKDKFPHLFNNK